MGIESYTPTTTVKDAILTKLVNDLTELFLIATEVAAARDGQANLLAKIDSMDAYDVELVDARSGYANLLAKISAMDTAITAAIAGSGVWVSSNDTTTGYLNGKLVAGNRAVFTENNNGSNETLTVAMKDDSTLTKTQANSPYTVLSANLHGDVIHDNSGASGECIFQLPAGAAGAIFKGEVKASQYLQVKANGSETIRYLGSVSAAGGYVRSNGIGKTISMRWNGSQWVIFEINGSWQMDA